MRLPELTIVAAFVLCLAASPLVAQPLGAVSPKQETEIAACIERSAKGRLWLAKTLWGLRDQEAGWVGAAIHNRDGSADLGPLQVNSWWAQPVAALIERPPAEVRWWLQHDACFNVDVARWIFLSALSISKDYWHAVGLYHSPPHGGNVATRKRSPSG